MTQIESTNQVKSVCPYCGVGCGMILHTDKGRVVKVAGDTEHPANRGKLCTKGTTAHLALESGRMSQAQMGGVAVPMAQALERTAKKLKAILEEHGPDALGFYVSGQMSLESQYLINKLAKGFVGSNHIDSNSRLCMAAASSGYKLSLGADAPPGSYDDLDLGDLLLVIGSNMADCHPILFLRLLERKKAAGVRLIVVDPRRTATAEKADLFMQIKPGTDLVLLNGLLHLLHNMGKIDLEFIQNHTEGWAALEEMLPEYDPQTVSSLTGIAVDALETAAQWISESPNFVTLWTMGLNQSVNGAAHTNAVCNLHLATGTICRPGAGPFSLTGQPNAMGGREVGYLSGGLPGQRAVQSEADREFLENLWALPPNSINPLPGYDAVTLFDKMAQGSVKALWVICSNPVASMPNRRSAIAGLERAELVIVQDAYQQTETAPYADVLLPGALWAEAEGVMINSERNITLMQKAVDPPGEALPDWKIICEIAKGMGYGHAFDFASASEVFEEIKLTYNPQTGYDLRGASYQRLEQTPLQWPIAAGGLERNPVRYVTENQSSIKFPTSSGKAKFWARPYLPPLEQPDADFPLILNTGRLPHQWHTLTKTGKVAQLNKLNPGPFLELHPQDAERLGVTQGDSVKVTSKRGMAILPARVSDQAQVGMVFAPFHWNDLFGEHLSINDVTSDAKDPISLEPGFKFCAVKVEKVADAVSDNVNPKLALEPAKTQGSLVGSPKGSLVGFSLEQMIATPDFSAFERSYLGGLLSGLHASPPRADELPHLPENAPFLGDTRAYVEGLLAGLYSRIAISVPASIPLAATLPDTRKTIHIWYGSQTGNAEKLALELTQKLQHNSVNALCSSLDEVDFALLKGVQTAYIISSTYGDGEAPDNAKAFWNQLKNEKAPKLHQLEFAVLALGDKSYSEFCGFGVALDQRLEVLGAKPLLKRVNCDSDYAKVAQNWMAQILQLSGQTVIKDEKRTTNNEIPTFSKQNPFPSRLVQNRVLSQGGSDKETRQIVLSLEGSDLQYQAGDALGLYPSNDPQMVLEWLEVCRLQGSQTVVLDNQEPAQELTLLEALSHRLEIGKITTDLLNMLAKYNADLAVWLGVHSADDLRQALWDKQLIDILHDFPPLGLSAQALVGMLRKLQPRLYSISSSPAKHPLEVHLTVGTVRYRSSRGRRAGVASSFLADRASHVPIPIFVQRSSHFRLPADPQTPVIMVGPGTGIAPFRGFLQEREATGATGKNWLFFGEQHQDHDFYYREELEGWQKTGLLSRLTTAFSRDTDQKVYVQHRMLEQAAELWAWLKNGAYFYVCGDASRMAKDVDAALKTIAMQQGNLSEAAALEFVQDLARGKRYLRDVY